MYDLVGGAIDENRRWMDRFEQDLKQGGLSTVVGDGGDMRTFRSVGFLFGLLTKSDYVSATRLVGCQMIEAVNFRFLVSRLAVGLVISERNFHLLTSPYPVVPHHRREGFGGCVWPCFWL